MTETLLCEENFHDNFFTTDMRLKVQNTMSLMPNFPVRLAEFEQSNYTGTLYRVQLIKKKF